MPTLRRGTVVRAWPRGAVGWWGGRRDRAASWRGDRRGGRRPRPSPRSPLPARGARRDGPRGAGLPAHPDHGDPAGRRTHLPPGGTGAAGGGQQPQPRAPTAGQAAVRPCGPGRRGPGARRAPRRGPGGVRHRRRPCSCSCGSVAGRWWGLVGAALWLVLPHALRSEELAFGGFDRIDRYAILDPVATALAMWAVVVALTWHRDDRWRWGLLGWCAGRPCRRGQAVRSRWCCQSVAVVPWLRAPRTWSWRTPTASTRGGNPVGTRGLCADLRAPRRGRPRGRAVHGRLPGRTRRERSCRRRRRGGPTRSAPWWAQAWYAWRDEGLGDDRWRRGSAADDAVSRLAPGSAVAAHARRARARASRSWASPSRRCCCRTTACSGCRSSSSLATFWDWPRLVRARWTPLEPSRLVIVAALVLAPTGVRSVAFVVTREPADYPVAAQLVVDAAGADAAVLVRGFPVLLTAYADDLDGGRPPRARPTRSCSTPR